MTKDNLHFAFNHMEEEIDRIPLSEITYINAIVETDVTTSECFSSLRCEDLEGDLHIVRIKTEHGGYNSGRAYYLRAESTDELNCLIGDMKAIAKAAKKRTQARTIFQRAQLRVRKIYDSQYTQAASAWIIALVSEFVPAEM
jgi:hypothetical protein